jgi:hypothetical protein
MLYPDGIYKEIGDRVDHLRCNYAELRSMGLEEEVFERLNREGLGHGQRVSLLIKALEACASVRLDADDSLRVFILPHTAKRLDAKYTVSQPSS